MMGEISSDVFFSQCNVTENFPSLMQQLLITRRQGAVGSCALSKLVYYDCVPQYYDACRARAPICTYVIISNECLLEAG